MRLCLERLTKHVIVVAYLFATTFGVSLHEHVHDLALEVPGHRHGCECESTFDGDLRAVAGPIDGHAHDNESCAICQFLAMTWLKPPAVGLPECFDAVSSVGDREAHHSAACTVNLHRPRGPPFVG